MITRKEYREALRTVKMFKNQRIDMLVKVYNIPYPYEWLGANSIDPKTKIIDLDISKKTFDILLRAFNIMGIKGETVSDISKINVHLLCGFSGFNGRCVVELEKVCEKAGISMENGFLSKKYKK